MASFYEFRDRFLRALNRLRSTGVLFGNIKTGIYICSFNNTGFQTVVRDSFERGSFIEMRVALSDRHLS